MPRPHYPAVNSNCNTLNLSAWFSPASCLLESFLLLFLFDFFIGACYRRQLLAFNYALKAVCVGRRAPNICRCQRRWWSQTATPRVPLSCHRVKSRRSAYGNKQRRGESSSASAAVLVSAAAPRLLSSDDAFTRFNPLHRQTGSFQLNVTKPHLLLIPDLLLFLFLPRFVAQIKN